ncbi:MAG: four helix bundle protein [Gemmatimonadaceae bacterium]
MRDFRKLEVSVRARELAVAVYGSTGLFPAHERYGLAGQMRRAAVSIASNIAEGTGRGGDRELLRFLYIALGSATELAIQVDLALALGFLDAADGAILVDRTNHVQRMLNRLTGSMRQKLANRRQGDATERLV